ncbi:TA system VapC family ribonuclease toxin [Nostocoides australiense]
MIIPDVNILLYAHVDGFAKHAAARSWWEQALSGTEPVGVAPVVAFGFVRIATSARVLSEPMSIAAATGVVEGWLARPNVTALASDGRTLRLALGLLKTAGTGGNLTTDAHIAAHALEHGAQVATNDTDFGRFPGVSTVNPLRST